MWKRKAFSVIVKSSRRCLAYTVLNVKAQSLLRDCEGSLRALVTRRSRARVHQSGRPVGGGLPVPNLRPESSSAVPASGSGTPRLRPPGPRLVRCGASHTWELWHQVIKVLDIKP